MSFNIENWERREIYNFFSSVDQPFYCITFRLDVTKLRRYTRAHGLSFYLSLTYLVTKAINSVPEFMLTIRDGRLEQLPRREPSFTDLAPGSECFKIVTYPADGSMEDFCREARRAADAQKRFLVTESESDALIFISCVPWADITSVTNERLFDFDDCVPRVTWGKFVERDGRIELGMSLDVSHRVIDGVHIGQFVRALEELIDALE